MVTDPFDAYKRDVEDADRTDALAKDARKILAGFYPHWKEDPHGAVARLMERGPFSRPDVYRILEFIDWEDDVANDPPCDCYGCVTMRHPCIKEIR